MQLFLEVWNPVSRCWKYAPRAPCHDCHAARHQLVTRQLVLMTTLPDVLQKIILGYLDTCFCLNPETVEPVMEDLHLQCLTEIRNRMSTITSLYGQGLYFEIPLLGGQAPLSPPGKPSSAMRKILKLLSAKVICHTVQEIKDHCNFHGLLKRETVKYALLDRDTYREWSSEKEAYAADANYIRPPISEEDELDVDPGDHYSDHYSDDYEDHDDQKQFKVSWIDDKCWEIRNFIRLLEITVSELKSSPEHVRIFMLGNRRFPPSLDNSLP